MVSKLCYNSKYIFLFLFVIHILNIALPGITIYSEFFHYLYLQNNFYSLKLDISKFCIFISTLAFGFILTNLIYFKERKNIFTGHKNNYKDFLILLFLSVFMYFSSGITVLRGKYDFEGFCDLAGRSFKKSLKSNFIK